MTPGDIVPGQMRTCMGRWSGGGAQNLFFIIAVFLETDESVCYCHWIKVRPGKPTIEEYNLFNTNSIHLTTSVL